jgi:hypothetical protein
MANTASLKPFKKGDPRINKKGRPKGFTQLRELAQDIAHETAKKKDGQEVVIDNHKVTVIEAILRQWASDPKRQEAFMAYAFGKVPQPVEMTLEKELIDLFRSLPPTDRKALATLFPDMSLPREGIEA